MTEQLPILNIITALTSSKTVEQENNLILNLAQNLSPLSVGYLLQATIQKQLTGNRFLLATNLGELLLKTTFPLSPNSKLEFEVVAYKDNNVLKLFQINETPLKEPIIFKTIEQNKFTQSNKTIYSNPLYDNNLPDANNPPVKVKHNIKELKPGTTINLEIVKFEPEQLAEFIKQNFPQTSNNIQPKEIQILNSIPKQLKTSPLITFKIVNTDEHIQIDNIWKIDNSPLIKADIYHNKMSNQLEIKLPFGVAKFPQQDKIAPLNNVIYLQLTEPLTETSPLPIPIPNEDKLVNLIKNWDNFTNFLNDPEQQEIGEKIIKQLIPQPDKELLVKLTKYIEHLKHGNFKSWVGHDILEVIKHAITSHQLQELITDFMVLKESFVNKEAHGNWQTILIPIYSENNIHQVNMFIRNNSENNDQNDVTRTTRFIVELTTKITGALQFDGLVSYNLLNIFQKRLQLIIRTKKPLPSFMKEGIEEIFSNINQITGINGSLVFQTLTNFPTTHLSEVIQKFEITS